MEKPVRINTVPALVDKKLSITVPVYISSIETSDGIFTIHENS